ncbi:MAG: ATP-dependent Clp protease ATP-binding subunit, partial [Rhodopirellula sp.]|nr:ATP-dependent Clp protease ATP-binding subunit [Rhodopirellula sp.]
IMTTNAGAHAIAHGAGFGFGKKSQEADYGNMKKEVMSVLERDFKPEFLGRLDEVVVFKKLQGEDLKLIIDIELSKVRERLGERGLGLELNNAAKEFIIKSGGDLDYGARPLRRAVEQSIEDPLSEELLRGAFEGKNHILVTVKTVGDQDRLGFEGVVKVVEEPVAEEPKAEVVTAAQ